MGIMGAPVQAAVAIVMALVLSGLAATVPPATVSTDGDHGCDNLLAYRNDVYDTFSPYPEFTDWWANSESPAIDAMSPDLADAVVTEGRDFVDELAALDVPPAYAEGHAGWVGLYDFYNDLIAWVVFDEGGEPDTDDLQVAIDDIAAGEDRAADVCAADIADVGGFVLVPPGGFEDVDVPADPLDIDKDFL